MTIENLYNIYLQHSVVCTDTRKISAGCIFFALKGDNFNGNTFARKALEAGASYAVIDEPAYKEDGRYILVDDVLLTLQQLASYHRKQLSIPVIGITGTNGKTTSKELFNAVLSQKYKVYATQGNLNNHIGVPLTILSVGNDIELAIVEMGANHQREIAFLCEIARPNYGLITNVGKAHLEGFGGFEGVKKAKGELYDFLKANGGTVFLNADNPNLREMYGPLSSGKLIAYGASADSLVEGRIVENDPFLTIDWISGDGTHRVRTNLTGSYNLENVVAAVTAGVQFGLTAEEINRGISTYTPGNNRSQIIKTGSNTIIGDYYNANPSSMVVALDNLAAISAPKKALILGDMFELGAEASAEHQNIVKKALAVPAEERIFIGNEFYRMKDDTARFYRTTAEACQGLKEQPLKDAVILVKGSRSMKLETLIDLL